jgi:hypothetical protein
MSLALAQYMCQKKKKGAVQRKERERESKCLVCAEMYAERQTSSVVIQRFLVSECVTVARWAIDATSLGVCTSIALVRVSDDDVAAGGE